MGDDDTIEEQAAPTTTTLDFLHEQSSMAYAGIIFSAIVLLISLAGVSAGLETHKHYKYGISVASIAMILSAMGLTISYTKAQGTEQVVLYNNYFLFVWNFLGASFLTFGGPDRKSVV